MTELERLTREYEDLANGAARAREALCDYKEKERKQKQEQAQQEFETLKAHVDSYNTAHGTDYRLVHSAKRPFTDILFF